MSGFPLAGVRVIEHGQLLAVPAAARMLSDLGAEVIKIEPAFRLDSHRQTTFPENDPGDRFWDRGGTYHSENRGKLGLTLDLRNPASVEIFRRLVAISDVVMENFTPRVMKGFGLDYDALRRVRPDIIMLSSTGYGHTGPWANFKAVGPTTEAASGVASVTGYEGGIPVLPDIPYTDYTAADQGVFAILAALYRRRRTGEGAFIDLSQVEAQASLAGELFMEASLPNTVHEPRGTAHPAMAPHDFFPCAGEDRWIAIAVSCEEEWQGLVAAMGQPDWVTDASFSSLELRQSSLPDLNDHITAWTCDQDAIDLMHLLQSYGVPAGAVLNARDLVLNEHLHARGFFEWMPHPEELAIPDKPYPGAPWRFSMSSRGSSRPAPLLGGDTQFVLEDLLGYSTDQISAIRESGAFGPSPEEFPRPHPMSLDDMKKKRGVIDVDLEYQYRIDAMRNKPTGDAR